MENEENVVYTETVESSSIIDGAAQPGDGLATASMICGIVGIVLCCCGPLGVAALVCSILAKNQGNTSGKATAGMIMGIILIVLWVINLIVMFATPYGKEYMDMVNSFG